jgi:DNA-binding NarL/FixJ family response regulator
MSSISTDVPRPLLSRVVAHSAKPARSAVIIESLPFWCETLANALEQLAVSVLAAADTLSAGLALLHQNAPGLLILDRDLAAGDAFSAAAMLRSCKPPVLRIITSIRFSRQDYLRASGIGIDLLLPKTTSRPQLRFLLQQLLARVSAVRVPATKAAFTPCAGLTARDLDVLCYTARGRTVRQMALALGLSPRTIDAHKSRLMDKLQIHDRVVLARYAIAQGFIPAWENPSGC